MGPIKDHTAPKAVPHSIAQLGLNDNELAFAASYIQTTEALARARYQLVVHTLLLEFGVFVASLMEEAGPLSYDSVRRLFHIIGKGAPVMLLVTLVLTIIGGAYLNRQLAATTLPTGAKHYLRRLAAGMDVYVLKRFCRAVAGRLHPSR